MPADLALLTFVKYPEPGRVKTRLAADIGARWACDLYRDFIRLTLAKTKLLPGATSYVTFTPSARKQDFHRLFPEERHWLPQVETSDLGERIYQAVNTVLAYGHQHVLTIGSDSPSLPVEYLHMAAKAVAECDVVLGPAQDGGYYLIGLKSAPRALFENIEWSTARVLQQTLRAARRAGYSTFLLPEWYDVDDLASLKKFSHTHALPPQFPLDFLL